MMLRFRQASDEFLPSVVELARVPVLERNSGESHYGTSVFAFRIIVLWLLFVTTSIASAADYFVAVEGLDSNLGTSVSEPFRTIGRAAQLMQPGDICWIREGVYREKVKLSRSGLKNKPITFARYKNERVIVDGSDPVLGPWPKVQNGIWKAKITSAEPIEAVFCDGRMMMEARWPNCSWEENWIVDQKWALTGKDSKLGVIESPELASSNLDLSGGLLYLKLSKGNNCFTRPITGHRAGSQSLEYDKTGIEGRAWNEDSMPERIKKFGFEQNRFFVVAKGALDAAGEWWHDAEQSELLFIPPTNGSNDPNEREVSVKTASATSLLRVSSFVAAIFGWKTVGESTCAIAAFFTHRRPRSSQTARLR
jgi:hypothetical protein